MTNRGRRPRGRGPGGSRVTHIRHPSGLTASRTRQLSRSCSNPFPRCYARTNFYTHTHNTYGTTLCTRMRFVYNITCRCIRADNERSNPNGARRSVIRSGRLAQWSPRKSEPPAGSVFCGGRGGKPCCREREALQRIKL